ncbi:hypothetical protein Aduo_001074 [Ancylostoma duodenale]
MRTLLLLLLFAGIGLFVSAFSEYEAGACGTCMVVVFAVREVGRRHSKKDELALCRRIQKDIDEPGIERLCRSIFNEIANSGLYDDIAGLEEDESEMEKFCRTKLSKEYCPRTSYGL